MAALNYNMGDKDLTDKELVIQNLYIGGQTTDWIDSIDSETVCKSWVSCVLNTKVANT